VLAPGSAHRRVVRLKDSTLLNRYWDDCNIPREESYSQVLWPELAEACEPLHARTKKNGRSADPTASPA
jgi:neutral trehalase